MRCPVRPCQDLAPRPCSGRDSTLYTLIGSPRKICVSSQLLWESLGHRQVGTGMSGLRDFGIKLSNAKTISAVVFLVVVVVVVVVVASSADGGGASGSGN